MGIKEFFGRLFAPSGNFGLTVTSINDAGDYIMVAGTLQRGEQPRKGNRFRVVRTGKTGTIDDATNLAEAMRAAMGAGASIGMMGTGSTIGTSVSFTTSDLTADDVQAGDQVVSG